MLYTAISITVVHGKAEKSSTSTEGLLGYWTAIKQEQDTTIIHEKK